MLLSGLVALALGIAEPGAGFTLKNALLEAMVGPAGVLISLVDLQTMPPATHNIGSADGADWRVVLSDFNATSNEVVVVPSSCKAPAANTTGLPGRLSFQFDCAGLAGASWTFTVDYALEDGAGAVTKGIRFGPTSGSSWKGTVREVALFRGMPLGADYVGLLAQEPSSTEFHPKAGKPQKQSPPFFGLAAAEIAAFFRTGSTGIFASLQSPFGLHTSSNTTFPSSLREQRAASRLPAVAAAPTPPFEVKSGYACGIPNVHKFKFIGTVASLAACTTACAQDPNCLEFEHRGASPGSWCALYNATGAPIPNTKFDCGCRGVCPTRPGPSPHPPKPPPGPRPPGPPGPPGPPTPPPNSTIAPNIWAWYEPMYLQTTDHPAVFVSEGCVVGTTRLQQYNTDSASQVNVGEYKAFSHAVTQTLLDGGASRTPRRVQVGWDSNDYQIDIGTAEGQTEYRRMLVRDGSVGITHAIWAPRNTMISTWKNSTDAWNWEETLFLGLGQHIRTGKWLPQRKDPIPENLSSILAFAKTQNVSLLAYVYPVLPFVGVGAEPRNGDGWLYDGRRSGKNGHYQPGNNPKNLPNCTQPDTLTSLPCADTRASLAHPAWQQYFSEVMIAFVTHTGCGGFAFDYTGFNDWRQPSDYAEWRGWMKILRTLRDAHPDIVIDHRQQSHRWGPWSHASITYTEPIAGDENPESYGAAGEGGVPGLSTDGVLANNLRAVNYVYRNQQLEPAVRIPGFWSHQSERHFSDGVGPGINGNTGAANFSAVHQRDFDFNGYRFGLLSSIGTAGLNNVAAMLPARDAAENAAFPAEDVAWIKKWLDFTDEHAALLHNTVSIATLDRGSSYGGGKPRVGSIDGTASFAEDGSEGVLFLFNPGPRPAAAWLVLDESLGIRNVSSAKGRAAWLAHELYPREETASGVQTPIGLWSHGDETTLYVPPTSAMVIRLRKQGAAPPSPVEGMDIDLPLILNLTHEAVTSEVLPSGNTGQPFVRVNITGATGLVGSTQVFNVIASVPDCRGCRIRSVYVNGVLAYQPEPSEVPCTVDTLPKNTSCVAAKVTFGGGSAVLRSNKEATLTSPDPRATDNRAAWFNSTLDLDPALLDQLAATQDRYPVPWTDSDFDATWLGNRLLLYVYVTQPDVNLTRPRMFLGGTEHELTPAYNSRGNVDNRCFLGFYLDATHLALGQHDIAVWLPQLNGTSELLGVFWSGVHDEYTAVVVGPKPGGDLGQCAAAAAAKPPQTPPKGAKNILYLVVDDLRPQLGAYGQTETHTPNLDGFAKTATVFDNAYCNIAVCSPSRNSFMSGMWPRSSHIYNFINHVRQATCPDVIGASAWQGDALRNISVAKTEGAAGQCCSECSTDPACHRWTYTGVSVVDGNAETLEARSPALTAGRVQDHCTLFGAKAVRAPATVGVVSGTKGAFPTERVSLPQHFKQQGYLVMQTGKLWHTEEGSPSGTGMPPEQDFPLSWSNGCSMANVNEVAAMWGCDKVPGTQGCPVDTDKDGHPTDPSNVAPLCDKIIGDDAVAKLQLAAKYATVVGRPFMLAAGFRKPHMPWRFPKTLLDDYPAAAEITTALHPTLDPSVPPIAHHTPDLQSMGGGDPWHALNKTVAQLDRLFYYASASWTDLQIGRVLTELNTLALTASTLVVFHSDHGWALGEHGQWQKFNNWEVGTRVPLIIRAPWLKASVGTRSSTLAELVDVFPTMCDLTGVAVPVAGQLDGASLGWALKPGAAAHAVAGGGKAAVLTQYPRCPLNSNESWYTSPADMWRNNWCEFVDRAEIPWMGYSMRTNSYRYTEWAAWNGTLLAPDWGSLAGVELYDHRNSTGRCFDCTENSNLAHVPAFASVAAGLSKQLHGMVDRG